MDKRNMIKNEQGEEMIFNSLYPYQLFEDSTTNRIYTLIVTRITKGETEMILLSLCDGELPNRYYESLNEQELLDLMMKSEINWVYKGSMPKPTYTFETKVSEELNYAR